LSSADTSTHTGTDSSIAGLGDPVAEPRRSTQSSVTNQTLDRGLSALSFIAGASEPISIAALAGELDIHRSMAYRIVRTLEAHGLTRRDGDGRCHPGHRLAELSRGVERSMRWIARAELERIADALGLTAFVAVRSGDDALTIDSAEPARADSVVSYRPGTRHPLDRGAPGLALLAGGPARAGERPEVTEARERGFARSTGEVVPGLGSIATWVPAGDAEPAAAVAVLLVGDPPADSAHIVSELRHSAASISRRLGL
jgi:DNA-binding IclR family transcriptional regulator